jgi:hypothetical protein
MMTVSGEAVSEEKVGLWEDFVDIFYAPSEVFARRRAAGFWMPLLIVAVVATILSFGTSRILEAPADADAQRQTREMVRENPELDVSGARRMTETIGEVLVWFTGFFVAAMAIGLGLMLWLGGKIAGSAISVRAAILIATYAMVPRLSEAVVAIVEGLARGPSNLDSLSRLSWSPARFLDPDTASDMAMFVASAVDLFAIWWLVVLAIGLAVIGNMPRARAAAVVAGIWVVLSLPAFIGAVTG